MNTKICQFYSHSKRCFVKHNEKFLFRIQVMYLILIATQVLSAGLMESASSRLELMSESQ